MHDEADDELERELRTVAAAIDPVPSILLRAAVDAFTWRTVDAELAELAFDSLVDQDEAALVRGAGQARLLSFETSDITIEVEVTEAGPSRRLIGQLAPGREANVDIRQAREVISVRTDELGRFTVDAVPAGPISLRCSTAEQAGGRTIVTDWVSI